MKLGLDFHGVITAKPKFFSRISKLFMLGGHDVHILTGSRWTLDLERQLVGYDISWTHKFSISDHHHEIGTPMTGYDEGQPKIDDLTWNKTKAWYCLQHGIDLHIDDSPVYGQYFITPYCHYDSKVEKDLSFLYAELMR